MKRLAIAALLLASPALSAASTQWYLFDHSNDRCEVAARLAVQNGAPAMATPYTARQAMRAQKGYGGTSVVHEADGLFVTIQLNNWSLQYFSTASTCESYKHAMGYTDNTLNELR